MVATRCLLITWLTCSCHDKSNYRDSIIRFCFVLLSGPWPISPRISMHCSSHWKYWRKYFNLSGDVGHFSWGPAVALCVCTAHTLDTLTWTTTLNASLWILDSVISVAMAMTLPVSVTMDTGCTKWLGCAVSFCTGDLQCLLLEIPLVSNL